MKVLLSIDDVCRGWIGIGDGEMREMKDEEVGELRKKEVGFVFED